VWGCQLALLLEVLCEPLHAQSRLYFPYSSLLVSETRVPCSLAALNPTPFLQVSSGDVVLRGESEPRPYDEARSVDGFSHTEWQSRFTEYENGRMLSWKQLEIIARR